MSDLRNCCSDEDLSTAPWCFRLSVSKQGEKGMKESDDILLLITYITQNSHGT